jgi:dUTP pyrophosphatase
MDTVLFKFIDDNLSDADKNILLPKRHSELASGFDLVSAHKEDLILKPAERLLVATGVALALPAGCEGQIRSRSGLALKNGVVTLNSPGTIDADYRGELKIILANLSQDIFVISFGMRIAQLVIAPVLMPSLVEVATLEQSGRGNSGFGSTGIVNKA